MYMTDEVTLDALRALHARGRAAWPGIELDIAAFVTHAASCLKEGPLDDARAEDLYLAVACAAGVEQAIAALDKHHLCHLFPLLIRHGNDSGAAADIVQAVRVRFLVGEAGSAPRIAEYDGRSSLLAWLRVAAMRISISAHRKQGREILAGEVDIAGGVQGPDVELLKQRLGVEFESAFRSAFEALTPRERNLLRHQVIDQLGIDRIGAIYGVHRATAARWVAQARETLIEGVRRALREKLRVNSSELDSLLHVARSDLRLSRRLFLTPTPERMSQIV
jgi:RNA polymerase sigma-70 factor, ECF subfamily